MKKFKDRISVKVFDKYDLFLVLVIVVSLVVFIGQIVKPIASTQELQKHSLEVTVTLPYKSDTMKDVDFTEINKLYFGNSSNLAEISEILEENNALSIVFVGPGLNEEGRKVFAGQNISINDRIKVSGGIAGDAYITKINSR